MKSNDEYFFGNPLEVPGEPLRGSAPPPQPAKKRPRFPFKKLLIIVAIIALLAALAFGAWKFLGQEEAPPASQNTGSEQELVEPQTQTGQIGNDVPEASETKTFKADHPRISFSYPATWTATAKDQGVRIESPQFKYQTIGSGEVTGNFRVYIRQGARPIDSQYIGRGFAALPSEPLTYKDPAVGQLSETNISFFGLDQPDNFAFFFIAGNFSLEKGDTLGPDYGKEPSAYIIAGGYSSPDLVEDLATHQVAVDFYDQTNAYKQALDIVRSLKLL